MRYFRKTFFNETRICIWAVSPTGQITYYWPEVGERVFVGDDNNFKEKDIRRFDLIEITKEEAFIEIL